MDTKSFRIGRGILLLFLIIYVGSLIDWVFKPFITAFNTLFIPIVLAGFLFYLLRPLVKILNRKLSRGISILLLYLGLVCIMVILLLITGPVLQRQFYSLTNNLPYIFTEIQNRFIDLQQHELFQRFELSGLVNLEEYILKLSEFANQLGKSFASSMASIIGAVANTVLVLVIVPFILFYMLKDGEKLENHAIALFNPKRREDVRHILIDIDKTLSSYIQGQGIVCLCVGLLCLITFSIIGLDYALLLAVIAGITNIIPYFGPWIGAIPAVIVGLFQSPVMALIVVIAVVVIQQVESSLISPQVIGKKLNMHPITVMFLILIAGRIIGLIGMILVVPTYGICRVLFSHALRLWRLKKETLS